MDAERVILDAMTTTRIALVAFVLSLSLACGDDDDGDEGGNVDDCDVHVDDPSLDLDEQVCKAVGLIVDCLDMHGVDVEALTDEQLRIEIDECAAMFEFCYTNPALSGIPEGATLLELREQSNMCVG